MTGHAHFKKMFVKKRDGKEEPVEYQKISSRIVWLCEGLDRDYIDIASVTLKVISGLYSGVETKQLDELAAETCATMATIHPDYGTLAARIFVSNLHKETHKKFSKVVETLYHNVDKVRGKRVQLVSDQFYEDVQANRDAI